MSNKTHEEESALFDPSSDEGLAMRHLDGDLSPTEMEQFLSRELASPGLQETRAGWETSGKHLADTLTQEAQIQPVSADDLFARIEAEMNREAETSEQDRSPQKASNVQSLQEAKRKKTVAEKRSGPRKLVIGLPIAGILAAAAAWNLFLNPAAKETAHTGEHVADGTGAPSFGEGLNFSRKKNPFKRDVAYAKATQASDEAAFGSETELSGDNGGTEIVEADFADSTGTVFAIEGAAGKPIAVVWIYE